MLAGAAALPSALWPLSDVGAVGSAEDAVVAVEGNEAALVAERMHVIIGDGLLAPRREVRPLRVPQGGEEASEAVAEYLRVAAAIRLAEATRLLHLVAAAGPLLRLQVPAAIPPTPTGRAPSLPIPLGEAVGTLSIHFKSGCVSVLEYSH